MTSPALAPEATRGADCLTTDGRVVTVRPARPDDVEAVLALHDRSSPETRYLRFFSVHPTLRREDAQRFVTVDHLDREALVVEDRGEVVALAGYDRDARGSGAEIAFLVDDAHQGHGIGSLLLEHLGALARTRGIHHLDAVVLATNRRMLGVFADAGFRRTQRIELGEIELSLDIDDQDRARSSIEAREHVADVASMRHVLNPSSIATVPDATAADALPEGVDLAIVGVPAGDVARVVRSCGERGAAACLVTTRLSEPSDVLELRRIARSTGMRLVGPGSGGLLDRRHGIDAFVASPVGPTGPVALGCQSSSVASYLTLELDAHGIGVASVIDLGSKADVSGNDLLQAWSDDADIRVAVLQLESLGNPHRFARITRRVGRRLPIVLLRTAQLHDCLPPRDATLIEQLGIIDVATMEEALDTALLLATEPPPPGNRVAVVSTGRGFGLLAADHLRDEGLTVTEVRVAADAATVSDEVEAAVAAGTSDAVVVVGTDARTFSRDAVVAEIPVVTAEPVGGSPARVAAALAHAVHHAAWTRRPGDLVAAPEPPDRRAARTAIWHERRTTGSGWVPPDRAADILAAYGIRTTRPHVVGSAMDAGEVASMLGYPVLLDQRSGHGAAPLDEIGSLAELARRWDDVLRRDGPAVLPMAVIPAGPRAELRIRVTAHPQLGPVVEVVASDRRLAPVRRLLPLEVDALEELLDEVIEGSWAQLERDALRDVVIRLSSLVIDNPELVELHLDSIDVVSSPPVVVGAHLRIASSSGAWDDEVRHLRRDEP